MNAVRWIFFIFSLLVCSLVYPEVEKETGTLIVSYHTGRKGERLNRVRFLLSSSKGENQIYPKGTAYVEDQNDPSRLVAIEDLPVGSYVLKFLVPNQDGLFKKVPERTITITKNGVVKIDQSIYPRYATIKVTTPSITLDDQIEIIPAMSLLDSQGELRIRSQSGKLVTHSLLPGTYTLVFESIPGHLSPEPLKMDLKADQIVEPTVPLYTKESGDQKESPEVAVSKIDYYRHRRGGNLIINQIHAQLTVNTNLPEAHWTLMRNNRVVYVGAGPVVNFQVPDGDKYTLIPEKINGYQIKTSPSGTFTLYPSRTTRVDISYERLSGTLTIEAPFPTDEVLELKMIPPDQLPPIRVKLKAKSGRILWTSPALPTGIYELFYTLPQHYEPVPSAHVRVQSGKITEVKPQLIHGATLNVTSNAPGGIFLLREANSNKTWKGEGREYSFLGLPKGSYVLSFSTNEPDFYAPPSEKRLTLYDMEVKHLTVTFDLKGKLTLNTNIGGSQITIQGLDGKRVSFSEEIIGHSRSFSLPAGRYRIEVAPLQGNTSAVLQYREPSPTKINLKAFETKVVNLDFEAESIVPLKKQKKVIVTTTTIGAGFTVYKLSGDAREEIGHYTSNNQELTLGDGNLFQIVFDSVPNYTTPEMVTLEIAKGETKTIQGLYEPTLQMATVDQGPALFGPAVDGKLVNLSAFSIGIYEVTNEQFSNWLNEAAKSGHITYIEEADQQGRVMDGKGRLVCKTFEADPYSQISVQLHSNKSKVFMPIAGKDMYPVINVSWIGALAYCQDHGYRLPTEAEWEKAAANKTGPARDKIGKYVYGFSNDYIDPTWANYKSNDLPIQHFQVLTTPVGYYNGKNYLPLNEKNKDQQVVHLAKSPYGAFDMSGNVWEWVSDWFDSGYNSDVVEMDPKGPSTGSKKVVKGGCYDSLAEGVQVTERMGLHPEHTDAFTGFRIVKETPANRGSE